LVDATDPWDALERATREPWHSDASRLVVDIRRESPSAQADDETLEWAVAGAWVKGFDPRRVDELETQIGSWAPVSFWEVDATGRLEIAVALQALLPWEASEDLGDRLEPLLASTGAEIEEAAEFPWRSGKPTREALRDALRESSPSARTAPDEAIEPLPRPTRPVGAPEGPDNRELVIDLLLKLAAGAAPSAAELAPELNASAERVREALADVQRWALVLPEVKVGDELPRAGRQFLARQGRIAVGTLEFLAPYVGDLNAREALRRAGSVVIDDLIEGAASGDLVERMRWLVPPAFAEAVDGALAARLFAAASALMARLASGEPAACVAEEIVAVRLISEAHELLAMNDGLTADEIETAQRQLHGVFELFEDDDVLMMLHMSEPADAVLAEHSPLYAELGVADQRIEAWFTSFGWSITTGHLMGEESTWP
jgi:hypothetical protein